MRGFRGGGSSWNHRSSLGGLLLLLAVFIGLVNVTLLSRNLRSSGEEVSDLPVTVWNLQQYHLSAAPAPRLIFTACCWLPKDRPCHSYSKLGFEMEDLKASGIETEWLQMPCSSRMRGPNVTSEAFSTYARYLQHATQRGDIVVSHPALLLKAEERNDIHGLRALGIDTTCLQATKFCVPVETSIKWMELALSGGDSSLVAQRMALQNKRELHSVFSKAGMADHVPALYSQEEVEDTRTGKVRFPIMVKAVRGTSGIGITFVHSQSELEKVVSKSTADVIFEEAIVGDTSHVIHYMRRPLSPSLIAFWCGMYRKPEWEGKGLFVQGRDDPPPKVEQVPCRREDTDVLKKILEYQDIYGIGCINGKYTDGVLKVFDWNSRLCGSYSAELLASLYNQTSGF